MKWNGRKETFERFAWRLRSAALLLPNTVEDGLLLIRLKSGLPTRLQDQAKLVSGTFDEVVSRVSSLSTAQITPFEKVREIREEDKQAVHDGASQSTVGAVDRFAHVRCHYCQKLGHISRGCDKNKSDRIAAGKAKGEQKGPAAPIPKNKSVKEAGPQHWNAKRKGYVRVRNQCCRR